MRNQQKKPVCRRTILTLLLLFCFCAVNSLGSLTARAEPLIPLHVTKGTNLITIARNFCIHPSDWKTIAQINHLKSPFIIYSDDTIRVPLSILRTQNVTAAVASVTGNPMLVTEGSQAALKMGDVLLPGQTITTREDEYVHLVFPGNKHTRIDPLSEMTLVYLLRLADQKLQAGLFLNKGKIIQSTEGKLQKNEHFETRTAIAVTGIRGTEFRLKVPDSETNIIETLKGQVTLSAAGKKLILDKGNGSKVKKDHPPAPLHKLPLKPPSPVLEEVYRVLPIVIRAPARSDVEHMRMRIAADRDGRETVIEQIVKTGTDFTFLTLADGHYQVYLTAIDQAGFESAPSDPVPLYVRTIPAAPIISSPSTGLKTFDSSITLHWLDSNSAQHYIVQLASDSEFTHLLDEQQTKDVFFTTAELPPGSYYFRVQLVAGDGFTTLFSMPVAWTVVEQPKMENLEPAVQGEEGLTLQWSAIDGMSGYMLQVARDRQFKDLLLSEEKLTDPLYSLSGNLAPGEYYIRMCAFMDNGQKSPWTSVQILTVEPGPLGLEHVFIALGFVALILL